MKVEYGTKKQERILFSDLHLGSFFTLLNDNGSEPVLYIKMNNFLELNCYCLDTEEMKRCDFNTLCLVRRVDLMVKE